MNPLIKNSTIAVDILSHSKEETYSQEVAEELDTTSSSVRRTVGDLYEIGFLEKTRREKAQYFRIDYSGMREFWVHRIRNSLQEILEDERFEVEEITINPQTGERDNRVKMKIEEGHYRIGANPSVLLKRLDDISDEQLDVFFEFYISNYLEHTESSTIEEMLFEDLFQSLVRLDTELYPEKHTSLPEDLKLLREALNLYIGIPAHLAVKAKFEEVLTEPELDHREEGIIPLLLQLKNEDQDTTGYTTDDLEQYYFAKQT